MGYAAILSIRQNLLDFLCPLDITCPEMTLNANPYQSYQMNGSPLPINHGASVRLRVETKPGFKMVKWLKTIELVDNYHNVGEGQGYCEDFQYYYGTGAAI